MDRTQQSPSATLRELLELAERENDESTARDIERDAGAARGGGTRLEFKRMFRGEMDCAQRLPRHPGRRRRHRGAGLGADAAANVPALGRCARLLLRGHRLAAPGKSPASRVRRFRCRASTPMAGCAPRPACTAWCASRRSIRAIGATPRSPRCSSRPRWTMTSTSRSIRRTCAWMSIAPAAPAVSTSTRPSRPCASRTCRAASWWPARMSAASTRTARRP